MSSSSLVMALVAFVAGACLRHVPSFPRGVAPGLHAFVVWVALPALILARVPQLTAGPEVVALVALPWALLALSAALVLAASRALRWPRAVEGALLMIVPLANTSFLGVPLVEAHLGREAVASAILWDQLGSFLALATYGALVVAAYRRPPPATEGARDGSEPAAPPRPSLRSILRTVVRFPPFIALCVALVLMQTGVPPLARAVFDGLGAALVPAVMVAVGLQWNHVVPRTHLAPAAFALAVRLGVVPLAAFVAVQALALPPLVAHTAVLEAGMGPMITAGALAIEAGLEPELTAAVLGWGTLASLATTALWAVAL